MPAMFAVACKQFLIRKNIAGEIDPLINEIGKYYYDNPKEHKNGEFDIVTKDDRGYIFYEAKYKNQPVTSGMIQKEIMQVNETSLNSYRYGFFSKSGFAEGVPEDIITYTLDDLYFQKR